MDFDKAVFQARLEAQQRADKKPAEISARRELIEYHLKDMTDFDRVKYFIYQNVKVYEQGFEEVAKKVETQDAYRKLHVVTGPTGQLVKEEKPQASQGSFVTIG